MNKVLFVAEEDAGKRLDAFLAQKFPEFSAAVKDCSTYLNKVVSTYKAVDSKIQGQ